MDGSGRALAVLWLTVGLAQAGPSKESKAPEVAALPAGSDIGREIGQPVHLADGDELRLPPASLIAHGSRLFEAVWTPQEGGGRPLSKGTGDPVSDPTSPLVFPRNFNRMSAMDSNSCTSCHSVPFNGGGGHFVANAFLIAQRFDFLTLDHDDATALRGARDERGSPMTLASVNSRSTTGLFGSGFIEMLARQMTVDLQAERDATAAPGSTPLTSKGISFGVIRRAADGTWDTSGVEGIPATSLVSSGAASPPSLIIRPFHQSGTVVSLRQFTNNAFNHHHGIQSEERFGLGKDPDGDGFTNELTRADVTAAALFQATLQVPGRVIPNRRDIEAAVLLGERRFAEIGCADCHRPTLPLDKRGWIYSEPNPFNLVGDLRPGDAPAVSVDLTSDVLPRPRLEQRGGIVSVPAFTDLKLHDITTGPDDPNAEPLDMNQTPGSPAFFLGNRKFLTKRLWGAANEPPFFHHGKFTTLREAILAHAGEAAASSAAFRALGSAGQDAVVEFLKTLRVLPAGSGALVVDERGRPKRWPPA